MTEKTGVSIGERGEHGAVKKLPLTIDTIVKTRIRLYDEKKRILKEADTEAAKIEAMIATLDASLMRKLLENGVENMRASAGTFYREEVMRPQCKDWQVFYKWIGNTNNFEALERRVTKKFVQDYIKEHGEPPPGVTVDREFVVRVRRSSEG